MFCKCFILHVTTYLQHVFNMLKHLQKCSATFFKCFSVEHLQNILEVVTCKIKQNIFANVLRIYSQKTKKD